MFSYKPDSENIPHTPGVYRFFDKKENVIYVGKAKNLNARLNSYFQKFESLHPKTQTMLKLACNVDWKVVATEAEALYLEYTWIKEFAPRYNVLFKDGKSYPFLALTINDDFPRIYVTRGSKKKNIRYFGPYLHPGALRQVVDTLVRVFPIRSCSPGVYARHQKLNRPCLLGDIERCSAPCVNRITKDEYAKYVDSFSDFMKGKTKKHIVKIVTEMKLEAQKENFERAAQLRDKLGAIEKVQEKFSVTVSDNRDMDFIAIAYDELEFAIQIFHVEKGHILGERSMVFERLDLVNIKESFQKFLIDFYTLQLDSTHEKIRIPSIVFINIDIGETEALVNILNEMSGKSVVLRQPQRGVKQSLMKNVETNAKQVLTMQKLTRTKDLTARTQALRELQEALRLPDPPLRMEAFDISSNQDEMIVASMVVFEDGVPKKKDYRHFTIENLTKPNDPESMAQVIRRRMKYLHEETKIRSSFSYDPSLIVVDGGKPQVNAAAVAMGEISVPVIGLSKRLEEIWFPGVSESLVLPRNSQALMLLQRIRDEAHRFAISHLRKKRSKKMIRSELDDIFGIGEVRKKKLMKHFHHIDNIRKADIKELSGVIPNDAAKSVFEYFHR